MTLILSTSLLVFQLQALRCLKTRAGNHPLQDDYLEREESEKQETTVRSMAQWHTGHMSRADYEQVGRTSRRVQDEAQSVGLKKVGASPHLPLYPAPVLLQKPLTELKPDCNYIVHCAQTVFCRKSQAQQFRTNCTIFQISEVFFCFVFFKLSLRGLWDNISL